MRCVLRGKPGEGGRLAACMHFRANAGSCPEAVRWLRIFPLRVLCVALAQAAAIPTPGLRSPSDVLRYSALLCFFLSALLAATTSPLAAVDACSLLVSEFEFACRGCVIITVCAGGDLGTLPIVQHSHLAADGLVRGAHGVHRMGVVHRRTRQGRCLSTSRAPASELPHACVATVKVL